MVKVAPLLLDLELAINSNDTSSSTNSSVVIIPPASSSSLETEEEGRLATEEEDDEENTSLIGHSHTVPQGQQGDKAVNNAAAGAALSSTPPPPFIKRSFIRHSCIFLLVSSFVGLLLIVLMLLFVDIPTFEFFTINPSFEFSLSLVSFSSALRYCEHNPTQSSVVVSMTTLPLRLPYLSRTLKSILMGSSCPQQIHVWVPRTSARLEGQVYEELPEAIQQDLEQQPLHGFTRQPRVIIHRIDQDYGPATKLLPTLLHLNLSSTQPIMVCDDDVLYSAHVVEQYDCFSRIFPDASLTMHGKVYLRSWDGVVNYASGSNRAIRPVDLIMGTSSFLVRPRMFPEIAVLVNYTALDPYAPSAGSQDPLAVSAGRTKLHRAAYFEDDWYWSYMLLWAHVPRLVIPIDHRQLEQIDTLIFVGRGSLTSTVNSREQDPVGNGRSNAFTVANAYGLLAAHEGLTQPIPPSTSTSSSSTAAVAATKELDQKQLHTQCSIQPRNPWERCKDGIISNWACSPVHALMSLLP